MHSTRLASVFAALLLGGPVAAAPQDAAAPSAPTQQTEGLPAAAAEALAPLIARFEAGEPEAGLELAIALHASGSLDRARPLYEARLEAQPEEARTWFLFARLAEEAGDVEAVTRAIDRAVGLDPTNADLVAWQLLWIMDQGGEIDSKTFTAFGELQPSDLTKLTVFGRAQHAVGNPALALPLVTPLMMQFSDLPYVAKVHGLVLEGAPDFDAKLVARCEGRAVMDWDAWSLELGAAALVPERLLAWATTASTLRMHELVEQRLAPLTEMYPASVELSRALSKAYLARRAYEPALAESRRILQLQPKDVELIVDVATILARSDQVPAAVVEIGRARELDPSHERVRLFLAQLARRDGKLDEALEICASLAADHPAHVPGLQELGRIQRERGDLGATARATEQVLLRQPWLLRSWMGCAQDFARAGEFASARRINALGRLMGVAPQFADGIDTLIETSEAEATER